MLEDRMAPAVLTVNTLGDFNDPSVLSLRQAIQAVNSQSDAMLTPQQQQQVWGVVGVNDQIVFAPGVFGTILLTQGELDITQPVVITGPEVGNLSIDAGGQGRVFAVNDWFNPGMNVTLTGLTITGGREPNGDSAGIFNVDTLTIDNCVISGNNAGGPGGGIFNEFGATLTVTNTLFIGNSASYGGGIFNIGHMTASNSFFFDNTALVAGAGIENYSQGSGWVFGGSFLSNFATGGRGGGIGNGNGAALTVVGATFSGNTAFDGGAIANFGAMFVGNCDLNGNSASGLGGGIWNAGQFGMTVRDCDLIGNSATFGGGIENDSNLTVENSNFLTNSASVEGGGINNLAVLTMDNSTFSGNTANSGAALSNHGSATLTNVTGI
jgi:hypothetical protein